MGKGLFFGMCQQGGESIKQIDYGYLYNFYAANDANFCPSGWHLPTRAEWITLRTLVETEQDYNVDELKEDGTVHWLNDHVTTNLYGFSAFGAGMKEPPSSDFRNAGTFWTSTTSPEEYENYYPYSADFWNGYNGIDLNSVYGFDQVKSVRLLKNTSDWIEDETIADYDGNIYNTVKIGNQVWTVQNWACSKLNDGTLIPHNAGSGISRAYPNGDESNVFI